MPERLSNRVPKDLNELAASIVAEATSGQPRHATRPEKDPAAVALGRRGGMKGGLSRARSLTAAQRSDAARRAAQARWHGLPNDGNS